MGQQYAYQVRLSEHIAETDTGALLCTQAIMCRSGDQEYFRKDLGLEGRGDDLVSVYRPPEEVLDPVFIATLPGRPVTEGHPSMGLVNTMNHSWYAKGVILSATRGPDIDGEVTLIGDLVLFDADLIERVKAGLRELSVGYTYTLKDDPKHGLTMTTYRANHLAVVSAGRAQVAMIVDADPDVISDRDVSHELSELQEPSGDPNLQVDEDTIPQEETEMTREEIAGMVNDAITAHPTLQRMNELCDQLEKRFSADETLVPAPTLSKSERGSNPVLDGLRKLRPAVEASRDRSAIDSYNEAITLAKRGVLAPAQTFLSAYDGGVRTPTLSWSDMLAIRGQELRDGKLPSEETDYAAAAREKRERAALDAKAEPENYTDMVRRVGREMCRSPHPRG